MTALAGAAVNRVKAPVTATPDPISSRWPPVVTTRNIPEVHMLIFTMILRIIIIDEKSLRYFTRKQTKMFLL